MFQEMIESIKVESLTMLLRVQPAIEARTVSVFERMPQQAVHPDAPTIITATAALGPGLGAEGEGQGFRPPSTVHRPPSRPLQPAAVHRTGPKVGRNDPCPCGSGVKYKKCHGK